MVSFETVDAAGLLDPGKNSGYRLFGTAATGDHSLGLGTSVYARTDGVDGVLSWNSRDRGDLRQSSGNEASNDEAISNLLAKGRLKLDDAQSLSGSLRYYNSDAREPVNPQSVQPDSSNLMTDRSTIQRDIQLGYSLHPADTAWLNADVTTYWSNPVLMPEHITQHHNIVSRRPKASSSKTAAVCLRKILLAALCSDRILLLHQGKVVASGTPARVM